MKLPSNKINCRTCFYGGGKDKEKDAETYYCRKRPGNIYHKEGGSIVADWPLINEPECHWCGEWRSACGIDLYEILGHSKPRKL